MKQIYLLQRAKVNPEINQEVSKLKTGEYIRLDYMGSAEFEFGAIPNFQKNINKSLSKLQNYSVTHNNQALWFMCLPEEKDEYSNLLIQVLENKVRLKERSGFDQREPLEGTTKRNKKVYTYDSPKAPFSYSVWFDLDNNRVVARNEDVLNNLRKTIPNSVASMK